jgi:hypothetical protein
LKILLLKKKKMNKQLIILALILISAYAFNSDDTYAKTYKVDIIKNGDYSHYP